MPQVIDPLHTILTPVLALVIWSLIVWVWMYVTAIPATVAAGTPPQDMRFPGSVDFLPDYVRQARHNYNHLMEQPTIFYALVFYTFLAGLQDTLSIYAAWGYVVLRIAHSLIQISVNLVLLRFAVFALSTVALIILAVRDLLALLG